MKKKRGATKSGEPPSMHERVENLGGGVSLWVSAAHTFGTDALLLSQFAAPRERERTCDLCAGCGIIPLLWFREGGGPAKAVAVDIQPTAVELMAKSKELSHLDSFHPLEADLRGLDGLLPCEGFDLVTCNPPYYRRGSGHASEKEAARAARHETLCSLEDVVTAAGKLLRFGGRFCLCHIPARLADVLIILRAHNLEPKRLQFCQSREDKAPWLFLVEAKKGAKPHLRVDPPHLPEKGVIHHAR
jgi:tRNA1(Val) A37 N6-methylase TrmN6